MFFGKWLRTQFLILLFLLLRTYLLVLSANCTFQFDSNQNKVGNFSSPKFPNNYPRDIVCYYHFSGGAFETLKITFIEFKLEDPYSKGCLSDYVDISTITAFQVKLLVGRFCGSEIPPAIQTMHPSAEIIFKTNHIVQQKGFQGTYEFKDESNVTPPPSSKSNIIGCGGVQTGAGGVIISPGYPASFPKNVECLWLIRVDYNQHIYLRILELQLYGSIANCADAELIVLDGYYNMAYNPKELKRYCGDLKYYKNIEEKTEMSPRNRVLIRFKTRLTNDVKRSDRNGVVGFKMVWTAVNLRKKGQCKRFICKGSQFCLNSGMQTCTDTRNYCIDQSLVCDGLPNCSDEDYSDEDRCNLPLLAGCGAAVGGVLLFTVIGFCIYRRHVQVRKLTQHQVLSMQLRQLEQSPSFVNRQVENFYTSPAGHHHYHHAPQDIKCSVHPQYDVIDNHRKRGYPTDV